MSEILNSYNPDIVCVTEGHTDQMLGDWHACPSEADHGYRPLIEKRRKVVIFSRSPWRDIDLSELRSCHLAGLFRLSRKHLWVHCDV
jgi:hypothetical protein